MIYWDKLGSEEKFLQCLLCITNTKKMIMIISYKTKTNKAENTTVESGVGMYSVHHCTLVTECTRCPGGVMIKNMLKSIN